MNDHSRIEQLRVPPQSIEAEQAVLGGVMLCALGDGSNTAYLRIADQLTADDFYRRDHQLIWRGIEELTRNNTPCDSVTLAEWFEGQGLAEMVAGGAYLVELSSTTPSAANITAYAEIVKDKATLRQLIDVGTKIVNDGFDPAGRDSQLIVFEAQQAIAQFSAKPRVGGLRNPKQIGKAWLEELDQKCNGGTTDTILTPWSAYNALTGGLYPGELSIDAGRPSMGKSAFAVNIALSAAMAGKSVLIFSLEMTERAIYGRMLSALQNVPLNWMRRPDQDDYWAQVTAGVKRVRDANFRIDDTPSQSLAAIVAKAKREALRAPVDLIVIDHLHLMPLPGKTRETVEIGHITSGLKGLAKDLNCHVKVLAQLNRSLEKRTNKRPMMSDLRESGNIEQDADLITFLYRDDYYAQQEERQSEYPGLAEAIVAKQREGETGKVWLQSALEFGRFDESETQQPKRAEHLQLQLPAAEKAVKRWGFTHDQ